jgi:phospholipid N-methyltransferase
MCIHFFHLKVQVPTEMPMKYVTLTDKISLLEKTKNQLPNTSNCQLVEVTPMPKSTIARVIQQQEKWQR